MITTCPGNDFTLFSGAQSQQNLNFELLQTPPTGGSVALLPNRFPPYPPKVFSGSHQQQRSVNCDEDRTRIKAVTINLLGNTTARNVNKHTGMVHQGGTAGP